MNKILSLLFAGCFFLGILLLFAFILWYTGEPPSTASDSLFKSEKSGDPPSAQEANSNSFPLTTSHEQEFVLFCQINSPDGTPIEGASVELESTQGFSYKHTSSTGASGLCRLLILQTGTYRITAHAEGYSPAEDQVIISDSTEREQTRILALRTPVYSVKGWVMTHSGKPVKDATVTINVSSDARIAGVTHTPRNGSFVFDNLNPGDYVISTAMDGYLGSRLTAPVRHNRQIVLRLDRKARLNGLALDEWRRPIAGATATISCSGERETRIHSCITQANGRFVFFDLPPQSLNLRVEAEGCQNFQQQIEITDSIHTIETVLRSNPILLQGKTIDAKSKQGIPGLLLELLDHPVLSADPRKIGETQTGVDGAFSFADLLPANYCIRYTPSNDSRFSPASLKLPLAFKDISNLVLEVQATSSVSGLIADETGVPIPNATVTIRIPGSSQKSIQTDQNGRYAFPALASVRQMPESDRESALIAAAHPDYAVSYSDPFQLVPGESIENRNLILYQGFSIQGSVRNNLYRPIANALVRMQVLDGSMDRIDARTDSQGTYLFNHVPLSVPKEAYGGTQQVTLGVRTEGYDYQTRAVPIAGKDIRNDLFILHNARAITGSVFLPDGSPAIGATVVRIGANPQTTETGNDGRFRLNGVNGTDAPPILIKYGISRYRYPENLRSQRDFWGTGAFFAMVTPDWQNGSPIAIDLLPENGIIGRVCDGESRMPLPSFNATLAYDDQYQTWVEREELWNDPSPGEFGFSAPLPGDYRLTIMAEGFIPANYEIHFYDPPQVRTLDVRLTRSGKGSVFGAVRPYELSGNILRLQLVGQGVDRPVAIVADPVTTGTDLGLFQVDNIPPGSYELFAVYRNAEENEARKSLIQFEAAADRSSPLGILDSSSILKES